MAPTVRACVYTWADLPDWGSRRDTPLLRLPAELLDRCFGVGNGLGARDYVALAGVTRYFRRQLDDDFFHAWEGACFSDGRPTDRAALAHPFSREVPDWRVPRPSAPAGRRGPRSSVFAPLSPLVLRSAPTVPGGAGDFASARRTRWTPHEYRQHKLTQGVERARARLARHLARTKRGLKSEHPYGSPPAVGQGSARRYVVAVVRGRKDGEPAVKVDKKGRLLAQLTRDEFVERGLREKVVDAERARAAFEVEIRERQARGERREVEAEWEAPESDDGYESEYDAAGRRILHDYWPSPARARVTTAVCDTWVDGRDAKQRYGLTSADLLGLKHVLATDYISNMRPFPLYSQAAVEALVLRRASVYRMYEQRERELDLELVEHVLPESSIVAWTARARVERALGRAADALRLRPRAKPARAVAGLLD
ncbi:hypothetical protein Q5752_005306 [Cryptotrichosporon argae]